MMCMITLKVFARHAGRVSALPERKTREKLFKIQTNPNEKDFFINSSLSPYYVLKNIKSKSKLNDEFSTKISKNIS